MRPLRVTLEDGREIAPQAQKAQGLAERSKGWLGRPEPQAGEGLLIEACGSIHTFGMGFAIDVAFVDGQGKLLRAVHDLRPGRVAMGGWRGLLLPWGMSALELPAGTLMKHGVQAGARLRFETGKA